MTVEEGAAAGVFAGQTNRNTFVNQRGVGGFSAPPQSNSFSPAAIAAVGVNFRHAGLHFDTFRYRADAFGQLLQTFRLNFIRIALVPLVVEVRRP